MIELAKHIEVLLLENDCVIVPGLGGFIAHNRPAHYVAAQNEFCPPLRTIGFNPQLIINDGLLVQSYMQAYSTDFPDATRKIEKEVSSLKEQIYQEGHVVLNNVGTLYYNMKGVYEFEPYEYAFFTPFLYGLETFSLPQLEQRPEKVPSAVSRTAYETETEEIQPTVSLPQRKHIPFRQGIRYAVSVAAAILLFFLLSVPVENTYIDDANYASLGSTSLFDAIRNQSAATTVLQTNRTTSSQSDVENKHKQQKVKNIPNTINTLKPVAIKTEKVSQPIQPKTDTLKKTSVPQKRINGKGSYIIVASLPTAAEAEKYVKKLQSRGYSNVQILESSGRHRIALFRFNTPAEAYKKIKELKAGNDFNDAWVFTSK